MSKKVICLVPRGKVVTSNTNACANGTHKVTRTNYAIKTQEDKNQTVPQQIKHVNKQTQTDGQCNQ